MIIVGQMYEYIEREVSIAALIAPVLALWHSQYLRKIALRLVVVFAEFLYSAIISHCIAS